MSRRATPALTRALAAAAALLAVSACSSPAPAPPPAPSTTPAPPLGPRPAVLRLDRVDPCALLTPAQVRQLRLNPGRGGTSPGSGLPACNWDTYPRTPDEAWTVILKRATDAAPALRGEGAQLVQVGGFPTVQTSSALGHRERSCTLLVDVAPGQNLTVGYDNTHQDLPGISHELACRRAAVAAELMVANLRTLAR
jgi:hypothetical protein